VTAYYPSSAPIADAGADSNALTGTEVELDGSASYNPGGGMLRFDWTTAGTPAGSSTVLHNPGRPDPSFVPDVEGDYVFALTVDNGRAASVPDQVTVSATHFDAPPNADAGRDQEVPSGVAVTLDGTASDDPNGLPLTYMTYDGLGNLLSLTDARGNTMRFAYDGLDRQTKITDALGGVTALGYDANGNLTGITDPLGRATSQSFDPLNRVVRIIDAAGAITGFDYDAVGNLTGVTDPRNLATTYAYDALERQTTLDSPDIGVAQSSYDANGNLTARTDSRGITASHTYDALDRRTATNYPDSIEDRSLRYDEGATGKGRLTGYDDPSGQVDLTYDARGNLVGENRTIRTQSITTMGPTGWPGSTIQAV